jgi:glycosyltransferase involved in cell wall biosynthesis
MFRVPCSPDYDFYGSADSAQLDRFRRKYRLSPDRKYLVYSGRLVTTKRVDLLIDAFAKIAGQRSDWDLMIVGDGVLREELGRRVPQEISSRVVWTGFLDRGEPVLAYHSGEVLVAPSDYEPWSVVVQEAMAAGIAVVASDVVGAARDLVEDGVSGRVFEAGDVDALAGALLDVTDANRLTEYKRQSRLSLQHWREKLDPVVEIRRALTTVGVLPVAALTTEPAPQPG